MSNRRTLTVCGPRPGQSLEGWGLDRPARGLRVPLHCEPSPLARWRSARASSTPRMTARPRSVSIFQSLLGSLGVVILLLGGATIALTFVGSKQTAEDLAGVLLEKTVSQVELNLRQFFEPATRALELLRGWEAAGLLDPDDAAATNRLLVPLLGSDRQLSAVMVADGRGREHILFHFGA